MARVISIMVWLTGALLFLFIAASARTTIEGVFSGIGAMAAASCMLLLMMRK